MNTPAYAYGGSTPGMTPVGAGYSPGNTANNSLRFGHENNYGREGSFVKYGKRGS